MRHIDRLIKSIAMKLDCIEFNAIEYEKHKNALRTAEEETIKHHESGMLNRLRHINNDKKSIISLLEIHLRVDCFGKRKSLINNRELSFD